MLGGMMSWSVVMRSIAYELSKENKVFLESINGIEFLSKELQERVLPCFNADLDLTYTIPENFLRDLILNQKIRAAIYNYESSLCHRLGGESIVI